jgi:hypothetical protein
MFKPRSCDRSLCCLEARRNIFTPCRTVQRLTSGVSVVYPSPSFLIYFLTTVQRRAEGPGLPGLHGRPRDAELLPHRRLPQGNEPYRVCMILLRMHCASTGYRGMFLLSRR